jgi:hypothetical protein
MLIRTLICMLCLGSSAYAQTALTAPGFEVHAKVEKKNALLNVDSPLFRHLKSAVLAEQCAIESIIH